MKALSEAQIKALLALPEKKPRKKSTEIDTSIRDYNTWFKLHHYLIGDTENMFFCDNENCTDPRPKERGQVVADVSGRKMCRICFLSGWLSTPAEQLQVAGEDSDS